MHLGHIEAKIAETSLCWQPDLIVMDGRKALVTGWSKAGQMVELGKILASGDLVALDVEAVKVITGYNAKNRLRLDPQQLPQVVTASKHGLGTANHGYTVIKRRTLLLSLNSGDTSKAMTAGRWHLLESQPQ
jgi:uncharacterized protein (DUF362 family)